MASDVESLAMVKQQMLDLMKCFDLTPLKRGMGSLLYLSSP
jgi:hypothetical protein